MHVYACTVLVVQFEPILSGYLFEGQWNMVKAVKSWPSCFVHQSLILQPPVACVRVCAHVCVCVCVCASACVFVQTCVFQAWRGNRQIANGTSHQSVGMYNI